MEQDTDLVSRQYILVLEKTIQDFAQQANEQLASVADELNRCRANFSILEKKTG